MLGVVPLSTLPLSSQPGAGNAYSITAQNGTLTITGQSATIARSRVISAQNGTLTLTGQSATLAKSSSGAYSITALPGVIALVGQSATIDYQTTVKQGGLHKTLKAQFRGVETEEQKRIRREAQGIIKRIQKAKPQDVAGIQQEAEDVADQIKEAVSRLELAAEAYAIAEKIKQAQNARKQAQELQLLLIDAQLQIEVMQQQAEELDVAFVVMMMAAQT